MPRSHRTALPAALPAALLAAAAQAQTTPPAAPPTFDACYVPASGTIYRIDTQTAPAPGAPKACLSQTHVKFTWNQQGPAGPKGDKGDAGTGGTLGPDIDLPGTLRMGKTGTFGGGLLAGDANPLALPSGSGTRFMWAPQKHAIRAGYAAGTSWNADQIGPYSTAFGYGGRATADAAVSLGAENVAAGAGSIAAGRESQARGVAAVALGQSNLAIADAAVALGRSNVASADAAVALGSRTMASGTAAIAAGDQASARGTTAIALGASVDASGANSVAIGLAVVASGFSSYALGHRASTNGRAGSFVYGDNSPSSPFVNSTVDNEFLVRAAGGVRLRTTGDLSKGCNVDGAGNLACTGTVTGTNTSALGPDLTLPGALTMGKTGTFGGGLLASDADALTVPTGPGNRLMWVPQKAALRAGGVEGSEWDAAAIGNHSTAFGRSTIASGTSAFAVGTLSRAAGAYAVAIGTENTASGDYSIALGNRASTGRFQGAFVFGDATGQTLEASAANQLLMRASGGIVLYSGGTTGVQLAPGGGAWQSVSDVRKKTAFRGVDGEQLLAKLRAMPMRTWQYRSQDASIRHMGPTAQDFRAAFALGESDTTITSVDADGVALAGVQALEARSRAQATTIAALRAQNDSLRGALATVRATTELTRRDVTALWSEMALLRRADGRIAHRADAARPRRVAR